jgi:chemotaxis protein histidine kinase CheA
MIKAVWVGGPVGKSYTKIVAKLAKFGVDIIHQEENTQRIKTFPKSDVILYNIDMSSHTGVGAAQNQARALGTPLVFARLSTTQTIENLNKAGLISQKAVENMTQQTERTQRIQDKNGNYWDVKLAGNKVTIYNGGINPKPLTPVKLSSGALVATISQAEKVESKVYWKQPTLQEVVAALQSGGMDLPGRIDRKAARSRRQAAAPAVPAAVQAPVVAPAAPPAQAPAAPINAVGQYNQAERNKDIDACLKLLQAVHEKQKEYQQARGKLQRLEAELRQLTEQNVELVRAYLPTEVWTAIESVGRIVSSDGIASSSSALELLFLVASNPQLNKEVFQPGA